MAPFNPGNRLTVALDVADSDSAYHLADSLASQVALFKVGMPLLVAEGPALVRGLVARGHRIMLDLKLHDIPATVARATLQAAELGVELVTVHASGGADMLGAAVWAAGEAARAGRDLRVLAVAVLPSLDQAALGQVGVVGRVDDLVGTRARVAAQAGCHGVVTSPREVALVRSQRGADFLIVASGVQPTHGQDGRAGQPKRARPAAVRQAGADLLVCGRALREADDPAAVARAVAAEIASIHDPGDGTTNRSGNRAGDGEA